MEQDRYQKNHGLFILGMCSLIAALSLLALSFYIMPNLLFGWTFDIPGFIIQWIEFLRSTYQYSASTAPKIVLLFVFLLAIFFSILAYFCSNHIDNQIYKAEFEANLKPVKVKPSALSDAQRLILNILLIALLIFVFAKCFEWLIYTPPPPERNQPYRVITY